MDVCACLSRDMCVWLCWINNSVYNRSLSCLLMRLANGWFVGFHFSSRTQGRRWSSIQCETKRFSVADTCCTSVVVVVVKMIIWKILFFLLTEIDLWNEMKCEMQMSYIELKSIELAFVLLLTMRWWWRVLQRKTQKRLDVRVYIYTYEEDNTI